MKSDIFGNSAVIYDEDSFVKQRGDNWVSESLKSAIGQFVKQMDDKNGIDNVTFNHEDYGVDYTVYLRRDGNGYLVSLESRDFALED